MEDKVNFTDQAEKYMTDIAQDVRPATLHVYRSILDSQLIPAIGGEELSSIGNATAKRLVQTLSGKGLRPATVRLAVGVMKSVLASAVHEDGPRAGDPLFPVQWNAKFIKAPKVVDQKAPVAMSEQISKIIKNLLLEAEVEERSVLQP